MTVGCKKLRSNWQKSQRRCVGTTSRRCRQKCLTGQESLLPPSGGMLRTSSTQRTFEKVQRCSFLLLLLPFLLLLLPFPPSSTTHASLPPLEVSKRPSKTGDQGQEAKVAKGKEAGQDGPRLEDKGKGKEVKPLLEAKGTKAALMIKDAVSKAKDADPKSKTADLKDDHSQAKVQFQDRFPLLFYFFFFVAVCHYL